MQYVGKLEHLSSFHGWKEQFQGVLGLTQGHAADVQLSPGASQVPRCQSSVISIRVREHGGSMAPSSPQPPNSLSHFLRELASPLTRGYGGKACGDDDSCLTEGR